MLMDVFRNNYFNHRRPPIKQRPGFGIIEVLIALGMATIIIVSVGNTLAANDRLSTASLAKERALNYARQGLEIIQSIKNDAFRCSVVAPATTCSNGSPDVCTVLPGYAGCWSEFPAKAGGGHWSNGPLKLVAVAGTWQLQDVSGAPEIIDIFTRTITISNSDPSCPPAAAPNHCNIKTVTVDISWDDHGLTKHSILSTVISGWKNSI